MEVGKNRERVGETMQRIGLPTFLSVMEVEPLPQHVKEPRSNPYVFWKEEEVPGGWERDVVSSEDVTLPDNVVETILTESLYKEII
jgi:dissimilatory sulfite reductase alpha subunit